MNQFITEKGLNGNLQSKKLSGDASMIEWDEHFLKRK